MIRKKVVKIILLGLEFNNVNKGCEALAYSFSMFLKNMLDEKSIESEYVSYVFKADMILHIPGTDQTVKLQKMEFKNIKFWRSLRKECKQADYIFDFTGGDSFSDIYGFKRFFLGSMVKLVAISSKTPFILGPQTYGVFNRRITKLIAKSIIKKSYMAYARDQFSIDYVEQIAHKTILRTTDIAFLLPYKKVNIEHKGKLVVGINPSGLLWNGGYNHRNQFGLKTDYQQYCIQLIDKLIKNDDAIVYLIPHVGSMPDHSIENDANSCKILHEMYPDHTITLFGLKTPMDLKGYIASMDVFIGARMHATIAAFSSGVATIPFSYSRKFEGLYNNLHYDYCINGKELTTEEAIEKTYKYILIRDQLKADIEKSLQIVEDYQNGFKNTISRIF